MSELRDIPTAIFDHVLWTIRASDESARRAKTLLGECMLLFTSLDSAQTFLNTCEDRETAGLRATIFSRNRKEFGVSARQAVEQGVIGALFDPEADTGEAPLLRFSKLPQ